MGILAWIILGFLAGWIASIVMKTNSQQGFVTDVLLGIVGAIGGGFLMNLLGESGVTGLNLYSLIVSTIGAILLIWMGRQLARS